MDKPKKMTFGDHALNFSVMAATMTGVLSGYLYLKSKIFPPQKGEKPDNLLDSLTNLSIPAGAALALAASDVACDAIVNEESKNRKHIPKLIGKTALYSLGAIAGVELFRALFPQKKEKKEPLATPTLASAHHGTVDNADTKWQDALQNQQQPTQSRNV